MSGLKRLKKFSQHWLDEDEFKPWLKAVDMIQNFVAAYAKRRLSSRGRGALTDHTKGSWHKKTSGKVSSFFSPTRSSLKQQKLDEMRNDDQKLEAQILWLMKSADSGHSNNSNDDVGDDFRKMDPNSKVLAAFQMKKTKAAYVINHGLALHYSELLYAQIGATDIVNL